MRSFLRQSILKFQKQCIVSIFARVLHFTNGLANFILYVLQTNNKSGHREMILFSNIYIILLLLSIIINKLIKNITEVEIDRKIHLQFKIIYDKYLYF